MKISIHAARVGSDSAFFTKSVILKIFQSTLPEWAATAVTEPAWSAKIFQSTLPEWAATEFSPLSSPDVGISIHAARVGSDNQTRSTISRHRTFQSTLPEWAATSSHLLNLLIFGFQSTLPEWAATRKSIWLFDYKGNFNPRCPSGQRLSTSNRNFYDSRNFNPRCPSGQRLTNLLGMRSK